MNEEDPPMDVRQHNQAAWNNYVRWGNPWTVPVDRRTIERARRGDWQLYLTPTRPVPREWFGPLAGLATLCLAAAGGQQGPVLAAAGAAVTVWDLSDAQLEQDRRVARHNKLEIETIQGDMTDLSRLADASFDLVVNAPSTVYVPDPRPVWREAFRVLRPGGILIAAFDSPVRHIFDFALAKQGTLRVRHRLPYSDVKSLPKDQLAARLRNKEVLTYGHTLEDQIGGQLEAGFVITGLVEDRFGPYHYDALSRYIATFAVTRAAKPTASISTSSSGRQTSATA